MNRFAWDLRYESPVKIPGAFYSGTGPVGPLAVPGRYQVRVTANGQSQTQPLELRMDPRVKNVSAADLQKELDLGLRVREANNKLHIAVNQMRQLHAELQTLKTWAGNAEQGKAVRDAADAFDKKMAPIEQQLIQVQMKSSEGNLRYPNMLNEQLDSISHTVDYADAAPTQSTVAVFEMLNKQLDAELAKWQQMLAQDLPALNQLMHSNNVPALEAPKGIPGE
jgi:paraquat-inducible protein B